MKRLHTVGATSASFSVGKERSLVGGGGLWGVERIKRVEYRLGYCSGSFTLHTIIPRFLWPVQGQRDPLRRFRTFARVIQAIPRRKP